MVYDKGPEAARCHASRIPPEMPCAAIDNKGNDWNPTWLKHVRAHYDTLPDLLIAVPSNSVTKHERFRRLVKLGRRHSAPPVEAQTILLCA